MKRRLLSLFILSAITFTGFTQSLELSINNEVIPPNSIIIQQAAVQDSLELITYIRVKNIGASPISVLCKKDTLSMMDSTQSTFCWGQGCYLPEVIISPSAQSISAGESDTTFSGHITHTAWKNLNTGECVVRWVFFNQDNVNDSASVTIKYNTFGVGIADGNVRQATLSNAYPNPANANSSFSYSIPSGSDGVVVVRNILGSTMLSETLSAGNGKYTINTTGLSDGIYFYSLMVDGKISQTKKLIVKH